MSFSNNDSSSGLRSFVSESQLEERRKRRQEEWEKVRTADQPLGLTSFQSLFNDYYY
jgi:hypothetical protein